MRHKAIFIAGAAAGFVAGTRAGREVYDKMVGYGKRVAGHPKVQQATSAAQTKATELTKTAAAKAPDYAKSAASTAQARVSPVLHQVPKYVSDAKQAAASKIPARFGGTASASAPRGPEEDGPVSERPVMDDTMLDGPVPDGPGPDGTSPASRVRYTQDTP